MASIQWALTLLWLDSAWLRMLRSVGGLLNFL